jgi:hypothetical protein
LPGCATCLNNERYGTHRLRRVDDKLIATASAITAPNGHVSKFELDRVATDTTV